MLSVTADGVKADAIMTFLKEYITLSCDWLATPHDVYSQVLEVRTHTAWLTADHMLTLAQGLHLALGGGGGKKAKFLKGGFSQPTQG